MTFFARNVFLRTLSDGQVSRSNQFSLIFLVIPDVILCLSVDDLKVACTCTTHLSEIIREVTWLATVLARSIQSCPVIVWD